MSEKVSMRVKAQRFGGKLSAMVLPNLGAFMGWGILTALGIWLSNDMLKGFITPVLTYLLPLLIGVSGGKMVYGEKGAVIGAGAIVLEDVEEESIVVGNPAKVINKVKNISKTEILPELRKL